MIVTLSAQQMLRIWRCRAGLETLSAGCSVQRFDGIDIDHRIKQLMREWYLGLLDSGDPSLIGKPLDASDLVSLSVIDGDCIASLVCDNSVRRLCSIRLSEWHREAAISDHSPASDILANRFSRAGCHNPVAWREPSGLIRLTPAFSDSRITSALAVIDPGPDDYRLDERALATIDSKQIINIYAL